LVKLELRLNGDPVDALSLIIHPDKAHARGKLICKNLKETIPRQMFDIAIQVDAIPLKNCAHDSNLALQFTGSAQLFDTGSRKLIHIVETHTLPPSSSTRYLLRPKYTHASTVGTRPPLKAGLWPGRRSRRCARM